MNIEKINYCTEKQKYILNHYEKNFELNEFSDTDSFKFMDWESRDSQFSRFYVLLENICLQNKSILDIGCGLGDLYKFISTLNIPFEYCGMDFSSRCVEKCRRMFPEAEFIRKDIFVDTFKDDFKKFDVVFCSGLFNLNVENNYDLLKYALTCFFKLSSEYVVFNLLSSKSNNKEDKYFYFNSSAVLEIVSGLPFSSVRIIEDYLDNDFTVVCSINQTASV
ncbi:MAG: class I SAM-dependent methyltransferase [Spirochaetes bacterium]|nr:class I SAM-dependent methyltransferase [Spirochaetota bacterium]